VAGPGGKLPVDPTDFAAMYQPNMPIPSSAVPCSQASAIPASWGLNASYDDRLRAQVSQDVSDYCVTGRRPANLPSWPPAHMLKRPVDSRAMDHEVSEAAYDAESAFTEQRLLTVGAVQPNRLTFSDGAGGLVIRSEPQLTAPPSAISDASASRLLKDAWVPPFEADWPAEKIRRRPAPGAIAAGGAVAVGPFGPRTDVTILPAAYFEHDAVGAATARRRADGPKPQTLRSARRRLDNLAHSVPGLFYDLAHFSEVKAAATSRYSSWEYVFGRGSRGLDVAVILSLAAVIASSARLIER